MTPWYKDTLQHHCLAKQCSDKCYYKGIWYTQTFSSQLFCGCNKNHFFHFFGLLPDMLRRQDLPDICFERRLKLSAMYLSIFRKVVSTSWFYCSNFKGNFEMTLEIFRSQHFQFPEYELSALSSVFFQQLLLKIQSHIHQERAFHIQESLRGVL